MKKKKIFVGLLLGAAVFSLAACTNSGNNTTTSGTTTSTTTNVTTTKYDVKYFAVVDGVATEVTGAKQEVVEGSTTTAPTASLAKEGYKIAGYYTNAACGDEFDFTAPIAEATEVYVLYEELGLYDTIATSKNKVFATDFKDITLKQDDKFNKTAVDFSVNSTSTVKVENDALTFPSGSSAFVSFGGDKGTGVYSIYFELKITSSGNGEGIFQLHGNEEGKTDEMLFEMRNDSQGIQWSYGADAKQPFSPSILANMNKTHKFLYTLDTSTGNLTIKHALDDGEMEEVYNKTVNIRGLIGVKFQGTKTAKQLDNIAVSFEAKDKSDYVVAKDALYSSINSYVAEVEADTTKDQAIKTYISDEAANAKEKLAAAFTKEKVQEVSTEWEAFKIAEKVIVTIQPTESGLEAKKVATTVGSKLNLSKIFYFGYTAPEFYSDSACQTPYDTTEDLPTGVTTIYAKVSATNEYTVNANDFSTGTLNGLFAKGFEIVDTDNKITNDKGRFKFTTNGSTTKNCIVVEVPAGTYTFKITAKSGSTGNDANLAVYDSSAHELTFANDAESEKTVTITVTSTTKVYIYRTLNTVVVSSITLTKTA